MDGTEKIPVEGIKVERIQACQVRATALCLGSLDCCKDGRCLAQCATPEKKVCMNLILKSELWRSSTCGSIERHVCEETAKSSQRMSPYFYF